VPCPQTVTEWPKDAQYKWYYEAYAPLDTPASMAPPTDHTTSIQTYFENCVNYLFGWLMSPGDEQGIHQQIAYSESCLENLRIRLGEHYLSVASMDSPNVTEWQTKYNSWVIQRRMVVEGDKVSNINAGHFISILHV
jgi:hypothetical protein